MTEKQKTTVRRVLNEHIMENEDMINEFDTEPETKKGLKEENEALEEALKVISKEEANNER